MKYINNNLEKIDRTELEFDVETYYKEMISFLESLSINKDKVLQIYYDSLNFVLEVTDGKTYKTKYLNSINNHQFFNEAGAFVTAFDQQLSERIFNITPGIFLRNNNIIDIKHIFTHETFHVFSFKTELPYNDQDILYTKTGLKVLYFNKKEELVNSKYNVTGLNEGVTELLTRKFLNENGNNAYHFQVIIADILSRNDSTLLNSYFSRNDNDVIEFFKKFNNNQNIISSDELIQMPSNIISDEEKIHKYLEATIKYDLSFISDDKKEEEINYIKKLVFELDRDFDYGVVNEHCESYSDFVEQLLTKNKSI